jgi:hypothetical protein
VVVLTRNIFAWIASMIMTLSGCQPPSVAYVIVVALLVVYIVSDGTNEALSIRAILTIIWPLVIMSTLDAADRYSVGLIPATIWMALMWWIDSYALTRPTDENEKRPFSGIQFDSHTVTAMSFGLCGLVGARYDTKFTHLILYALMICIMFVLPVHNISSKDPFSKTVNEVQRMCLVYSISFLISGVVLTRSTQRVKCE